jgi:ABC-type tungstate transport system permease subunit
MKKNKTLINELRKELHYHQMMVRVDLNSVRAGVRKCKEIAAKMRELQNVDYGCLSCGERGGNHLSGCSYWDD